MRIAFFFPLILAITSNPPFALNVNIGLSPSNVPANAAAGRQSASAFKVHQVIHYKVNRNLVCKVFKVIYYLFVACSLLFEYCSLFYLYSRTQRNAVGVKYRAFALGILFVQFLQRRIKLVECSAHRVRETDIQYIFALCKVGFKYFLVVFRVESRCNGYASLAHSVVKVFKVRFFSQIVIIFLTVYRVWHTDIVQPQFFGTGIPQLTVRITYKYTHFVFPFSW